MRTSNVATRGVTVLFFALVALAGRAGVSRAQGEPAAKPVAPATTTTPKATPTPTPAAAPATAPAGTAPAGTATAATAPADGTVPAADGAEPSGEEMPVNLRLRRLEQRVQALKERAWRAKARVAMLKEAVLGGGVGAQATVVHQNNMGSAFRLTKLVYALDGSQIFARGDDGAQTLYKTKSFDILTGPIAPGSHTVTVLAIYRGHGYGVFKYLTKYTFTVRSSHTFTVEEGKALRVEAVAFEKGGATTALEKRPAIDFKVTLAKGAGI